MPTSIFAASASAVVILIMTFLINMSCTSGLCQAKSMAFAAPPVREPEAVRISPEAIKPWFPSTMICPTMLSFLIVLSVLFLL